MKKLIMMSLVAALSASVMVGCGETASVEDAEVPTSAKEQEETGMANPWVEIDEDQAKAEIRYRLFKAPEGALDQVWMMCEELGDIEQGITPMIQLSFTMDKVNYTARAQAGVEADVDIAGNYVEWVVGPDAVTLANWNEEGMAYRAVDDTGYVDMLTWYDPEMGVSYALTATAADLDGFDIQAVVEQMWNEENDPYLEGPEDFLQNQSGKTSFASFDEAASCLEKGQGYAIIKDEDCNEYFLAAENVTNGTAGEAAVYMMQDGKAKNVGSTMGGENLTALRYEDGILYDGNSHLYGAYYINPEYPLCLQAYVSDGADYDNSEFTGFYRTECSYDSIVDFTGGQEEFQKLLAEREKKAVVEFTVVE